MRLSGFVRAFLGTVGWSIPCAVFFTAGLAKLLVPPRLPPALLDDIPAGVYQLAMQGLGIVECVVAVLLVVSKTRRSAAIVCLSLLLAFSVLAAMSSMDAAFAENCGCFGGLSGVIGGSGTTAILVRNSLLAGVLVTVLPSARTERIRVGIALRVSTIWFLASLCVSEANGRAFANRLVLGLVEAQRHENRWRMPNVQLRTREGVAAESDKALRTGDLLVVFSPSCPHCGDLADRWPGLARRLDKRASGRAADERLVLIALEGGAKLDEFLDQHDLNDLPTFVLADQLEQVRLGILAVPTMMRLGPEHQVVLFESQPRTVPVVVTGSMLPEGSTPVTVVSGSSLPAFATTLLVRSDAEGIIEEVRVVAAGGYITAIDPEFRLPLAFRGLSIADAIKMARRLAAEPTVEADVWRSLGDSLAALPGRRD